MHSLVQRLDIDVKGIGRLIYISLLIYSVALSRNVAIEKAFKRHMSDNIVQIHKPELTHAGIGQHPIPKGSVADSRTSKRVERDVFV